MNQSETVDVLTAIAAYDLRTVGESDVVAWHAAIGELDKPLALEAVIVHHKTSADRCKPAHVLGIAKSIRKDRAERESERARQARQARLDAKHGLTQGDPQLGNLPIGGVEGTPVPGAYEVNGAVDRGCPKCGAGPMEPCTNRISGQPRKMPCLARLTGKRPKDERRAEARQELSRPNTHR